MSKFFKILFSVFVFLVLNGCDRSQEKAKVTVSWPINSQLQKASVKGFLQSGKVSAMGTWGQPIPASLNDFNCYAVFVGGPEDSMRQRACISGQGTSFQKFYFNNMVGFISRNDSINLEVPSGKGRTFYLLGVKTTDGTCQSLANPEAIDQSKYSEPMLLGQAVADLNPGSNEVAITAVLNTDAETQRLRGCSFIPGAGEPTGIYMHGAVSTRDPGVSILGVGTCNRVRVGLESSNGDILLENPYTVNFTKADSSFTIHSEETCTSTEISSAAIPKGGRYVDVFVKAASGTTSSLGVVGSSPDLPSFVNNESISLVAQTAVNKIRFFQEQLKMSPYTCEDIYFWGVGASGESINLSNNFPIGVYNLAGLLKIQTVTDMSSQMNGTQRRLNCSTAGDNASFDFSNKAHGRFALYLGGDYSDFQIGSTVSSNNYLVPVNTVVRADHLNITAASNTPFASDCTVFTISALGLGGFAADLNGADSSPWSLVLKRVLANANANKKATKYFDNTCSAVATAPNSESILNASNPIERGFRFGVSDVEVSVAVSAGDFTRLKTSAEVKVTPQWDPGLLGSSLQFWLTPETFHDGSSYITSGNATNWKSRAPLVVNTTTTFDSGTSVNTPPALTSETINGRAYAVQSFNDSSSAYISKSGLALGDFSVGIVFKMSGTINPYRALFSVSSSTANLYYTLAVDSSSPNKLVMSKNAGAGSISSIQEIGSAGDFSATWHTLFFVRDQTNSKAKIFLDGVQVGIELALPSVPNLDKITIGNGGIVTAEFKVFSLLQTSNALDGVAIKKIHNYYADKYGVVTPVP